jgi:AcrR family transcriptional regulator
MTEKKTTESLVPALEPTEGEITTDNNEDEATGDVALARLLVQGLPITTIAKQLGVSRGLIHRRLKTPAFRALLGQARDQASLELLQRLLTMDRLAVEALADCLAKGAPPGIRLQAVRLLYDMRQRLVREVDFAAELGEIQEWIRAHGGELPGTQKRIPKP